MNLSIRLQKEDEGNDCRYQWSEPGEESVIKKVGGNEDTKDF